MPWVRVNGMAVHLHCDKRMAAKLRCEGCGRNTLDHRECDWKMPGGGTCDAPCCEYCAIRPAPEKDVCRAHAAALGEWMLRGEGEVPA